MVEVGDIILYREADRGLRSKPRYIGVVNSITTRKRFRYGELEYVNVDLIPGVDPGAEVRWKSTVIYPHRDILETVGTIADWGVHYEPQYTSSTYQTTQCGFYVRKYKCDVTKDVTKVTCQHCIDKLNEINLGAGI